MSEISPPFFLEKHPAGYGGYYQFQIPTITNGFDFIDTSFNLTQIPKGRWRVKYIERSETTTLLSLIRITGQSYPEGFRELPLDIPTASIRGKTEIPYTKFSIPYISLAPLYQMSYYELMDVLNNMFNDTSNHMNILANMHEICKKFIPIRSGKLVDSILNSMVIFNYRLGTSNFVTKVDYILPADRPYPFNAGKVQHAPPETGWGETYNPTNTIPNRHPIENKGNKTKYLLDDPNAVPDFMFIINDYATQAIKSDVINRMTQIELEVRL